MAITGIVRFINRQRGMVAIETQGGYTIIELLGDDDIEVGDEMTWTNDTGLGGETYRNRSKRRNMSVYVQDHWVGTELLRKRLLLD